MHLGNIVIHTESAAHIHVGDAEPLLGKPPVGSIDLPTKLREDPQVGYLGTDMEMQSHDVDVAQVAQHSHHIRYLPGRDSELVLRKARSNITVGVGSMSGFIRSATSATTPSSRASASITTSSFFDSQLKANIPCRSA